MYITDIANWICRCPYYLTNRFSLCKHLVQKKGIVTAEFFANIKRNYQPPFLIEDNPSPHIDNEQNFHEDEELHIMDESNENSNELFDDLINTTRKPLSLLEEQKLAGNIKWCKAVKKSFNSIAKLVEDVEQYRRKRTMPLTWKGHSDNTRYLQ